jgi:hypothetical protein
MTVINMEYYSDWMNESDMMSATFLSPPTAACPGIFPGDAVLQMSSFVSAGFWLLIPYYAQDHTLERFRRRIQS